MYFTTIKNKNIHMSQRQGKGFDAQKKRMLRNKARCWGVKGEELGSSRLVSCKAPERSASDSQSTNKHFQVCPGHWGTHKGE